MLTRQGTWPFPESRAKTFAATVTQSKRPSWRCPCPAVGTCGRGTRAAGASTVPGQVRAMYSGAQTGPVSSGQQRSPALVLGKYLAWEADGWMPAQLYTASEVSATDTVGPPAWHTPAGARWDFSPCTRPLAICRQPTAAAAKSWPQPTVPEPSAHVQGPGQGRDPNPAWRGGISSTRQQPAARRCQWMSFAMDFPCSCWTPPELSEARSNQEIGSLPAPRSGSRQLEQTCW